MYAMEAKTNSIQHAIMRSMLRSSTLARELSTIYESLSQLGAVHVRINRWLQFSTALADSWVAKAVSAIRPYETLLLLEDPIALIKQLPIDTSPQVG